MRASGGLQHPAPPRSSPSSGSVSRPSRSSSAMAKNAKIRLRPMISFGRAEPVAVAKPGRPVVVVMAVEEFERLKLLDAPAKREGHPSTDRPYRRRTSRQMRWIGSHKRRAGSPRSQRQQNVCGLQNLVGPMPWLRIATDAVRFTSAGSILPLCKSCIIAVVLIEIIHSIHHA